jgi:PAS domain S-box-containing protein
MLPCLGIVLYTGLESRSHAIEEARARTLRMEQRLASNQERTIDNTKQLLEILTKIPAILDRTEPYNNTLLKNLLAQNPCYTDISVANPKGQVYISAYPAPNINVSEHKCFRDAMATHSFSVGEYGISNVVKKPSLHFAYPALDPTGKITAIIIAAFDLNFYGRLFSQERLGSGSALALTDINGTRLYRYPDNKFYSGAKDLPEMISRMSGKLAEGTFIARGIDGVLRFYAFKRLRLDNNGPALYMRVGIPASKVVADANAAMLRNLVFMGTVTLLALLSVWLLADFLIVKRLFKLVDFSRRLGAGALSVRTGLSHGDGEFGQLARSFDEMVETMEKRAAEREQVEKALIISERNLVEAQSIAGLGSWEYDVERDEEFRSAEFFRILGLSQRNAGRAYDSVFDYIHPDDKPYVLEKITATLEKGKPYDVEYRIIGPNGGERIVHAQGKVSVNANGKISKFVGTVLDITERKKLEQKFLQAQKMEAVGQLAGGVAHDFNNILTAIIGYAHLMLDKIVDEKAIHCVKQVTALAERAGILTRDLLMFSRKHTYDPKPLEVNDIIRKVGKFLIRLIGEDIEFHTQLHEEKLPVKAVSGQIEQVLMNLATNARDAMPNGGLLTIRTDLVQIDNDFIAMHGYGIPGDYALISVSDTGTGMEEKVRERVFEPFFTTKEVGKGTGLGLATAYGIIEQHGGYITVYSELGEGTSFRILLPLMETKIVAEEGTEDQTVTVRGNETILLAEDELEVRESMRSLLHANGYKVIVAVDGEHALETYLANEGDIDLLLLDVIMPKRNGREVYEIISKASPNIKTIFISGYTADIIERKGIPDGCRFVTKPFSPHSLLGELRDVLDESTPASG